MKFEIKIMTDNYLDFVFIYDISWATKIINLEELFE